MKPRFIHELIFWHQDKPEEAGVKRLNYLTEPSEPEMEINESKYLQKYIEITGYLESEVKFSSNIIERNEDGN